MRRGVLLIPLLTAFGCSSFGTAADAPDPPNDGGSDPDAMGHVDGDASNGDAGPAECLDLGESAFEQCDSHSFCDDFDDAKIGENWLEVDEANGGDVTLGAGRNGTGFASKLSEQVDSRARLMKSVTPLASERVHVDFDLQTHRPEITRDDGFVDLVGFLAKRSVEEGATGLEWGRGGFRAFIGGTRLEPIQFRPACSWIHVHVAIVLRADATGSLEVWINGKSELAVKDVKTAKEASESTIVALGGWARYVTGTNEIGYDNVSVYVAP